jgi:hypothetical protein
MTTRDVRQADAGEYLIGPIALLTAPPRRIPLPVR